MWAAQNGPYSRFLESAYIRTQHSGFEAGNFCVIIRIHAAKAYMYICRARVVPGLLRIVLKDLYNCAYHWGKRRTSGLSKVFPCASGVSCVFTRTSRRSATSTQKDPVVQDPVGGEEHVRDAVLAHRKRNAAEQKRKNKTEKGRDEEKSGHGYLDT